MAYEIIPNIIREFFHCSIFFFQLSFLEPKKTHRGASDTPRDLCPPEGGWVGGKNWETTWDLGMFGCGRKRFQTNNSLPPEKKQVSCIFGGYTVITHLFRA